MRLSKRRFWTLLGLGLLCLGVFASTRFHRSQVIPFSPKTAPAAGRMVFQPEAQMLTQALDAGSVAAAATGTPTAPALHGGAPYAYETRPCPASAAAKAFPCYSSHYRELVRAYGVDVAVADMKRRFAADPYVTASCHPLMHIVGQEASKSFSTVSEAYLHGDSFCWSGYYHGILEGVIAHIGLAHLPEKLNGICADIPGKAAYTFDYYNCVHGLGHGIMEALGDEVPDSLIMCDRLDGEWERQSCYSGVFMENIISDERDLGGQASAYLKPSAPLFPCDIVEDRYKTQCYLGQTSYALERADYDFSVVADLCAGVAAPFRGTCFQSYGRDAANQARHDPSETKKTCAIPADAGDRLDCAVGAAREFVSYQHSDAQAKAFCDLLDEGARATCLSVTDAYYRLF